VTTYREAGVDREAAHRAVELIRAIAAAASRPEVVAGVGGFAGAFRLPVPLAPGEPSYLLAACCDGVGTKLLLAEAMGRLDTVGIDLVAMNANDLDAHGAEPLFFLDYVACGKLDPAVAATGGGNTKAVGPALREALLGGSVLLLLGSFGIGLATGERGMALLQPLVKDLFPGALALFLLDLGMTAARRFREFLRLGWFLAVFGLVMPLTAAALGALVSALAGLHTGDAALLMTLAASASYIAAPAAVRLALPEANPSLSITLSLGITFPFNILVGIPLYYAVAQTLLGAR